MSREGVTINELSKMANVTVRTIRFYTDEGVLDEPAGRDRYARYTRKHYLQLCAAKKFKERFLPLRVIRDEMAALGESELEQFVGPVSADIEARFQEAAAEAPVYQMVAEHAPDRRTMLRQRSADLTLNAINIFPDNFAALQGFSADAATDTDTSPVFHRRVPAAAVGDVWHRIVISPSMELHVRDDGMQNEMGEVRRILAALRRSK
ncbi:MAG: hypothetical protein RLZZ297_1888 [Chloroflexota bacterium]